MKKPSLISMARTPEDKKEHEAEMESYSEEDFPWGLSIHLGERELDKLGMNDGSLDSEMMVNVTAVAMVKSAEARSEGGKVRRSVTLQIQQLGLEVADKKPARAATLYGDSNGEDDS